jgi:putative ABC transport system ATP-binding protein
MVLRRCLTLSKEVLQLKSVSKSYPEEKDREILVLDNISIKFNSKNLSMVVGPMGSGKSTLLRIAGLLESPSSGSVIFANEDLTNPTPQERLNLVRHKMGFVPPYPSLLPYLTILENVMLPMIKKDKKVAVKILKDLGVEGVESYPKQISTEEQQKVSLARALVNSPQLLLIDEPTSSLSQSSTTNMMEILKNLKKDHTVLIFTDDIGLLNYSDVVYKLNKGALE